MPFSRWPAFWGFPSLDSLYCAGTPSAFDLPRSRLLMSTRPKVGRLRGGDTAGRAIGHFYRAEV